MGNNSQWGNKINETNLFIQEKKKNLGIGKKYTQTVGKMNKWSKNMVQPVSSSDWFHEINLCKKKNHNAILISIELVLKIKSNFQIAKIKTW